MATPAKTPAPAKVAPATAAPANTNSAAADGDEDTRGIKYSLFNEAPAGILTVAGILKSIGSKDTPYGPVKKFKGDFAVKIGTKVTRAGVAYFPAEIANNIESNLPKENGKAVAWSSLEFKLTANKVEKNFPTVSMVIAPRAEPDRVSELINS